MALLAKFSVVALLFALVPSALHAASGTLYVSPEYGSYTIDEVFEVRVLANSDGDAINAAEAELQFDPTGLVVQGLSIEGSIFDSWPTAPTFSNEEGVIRFAGWAKESYTGSDGLLLTIQFRALRPTRSSARFAAGAMLAADGKGSNIIKSLKSGAYTIEPQQLAAEIPEPVEEPVVQEETTPTTTEVMHVSPPVLSVESRIITPGERIVVQGTVEPLAHVYVYLAHGENDPDESKLVAAPDGSFTYVSRYEAEAGVYRVWAEAQNARGVRSSLSETLTLVAQSAGLASAVSSGVTLISAILPLIALLVVTGLAAGYLLHRHKVEKMKLALHVREEDGEVGEPK